MPNMHRVLIFLFLAKVSAESDAGLVQEMYKIAVSVKKCLSNKHPVVCLKERALEALNETVFLDEPIMIGYIRVEKNKEYDWNKTVNSVLPNEVSKRSLLLNDALYDKVRDFFRSRTIKLNVDEAIEGRKGKGGGGGGGGGGGKGVKGAMMMAAAAACVGAGMMMGKMGMMAMASMMMAKLSLLLSAIMILKKKGGNGGGGDDKEKQIKIVYATSGGGGGGDYGKGGGGGGGGWHRSLHQEPHTITYRAQIPDDVNARVYYEGKAKCEEQSTKQEVVAKKEA